MIGYSPKFPLQFDNYVGAYALTQTLKEVVKQNFINLMLTSPGERIMDINFGVGLRNYLFEQDTSQLKSKIAADVRNQTRKYMPFISLDTINFNKSQVSDGYDDQILNISIYYSVSSMNILDSISIGTGGDS
jgi:phage baseplate assembly protein W